MNIDEQIAAAPQVGIEKAISETIKYELNKKLYPLESRAKTLDSVITHFWKEETVTCNLEEPVTVFLKLAEDKNVTIFRVNSETKFEEYFDSYTLDFQVKNWSQEEPKECGYNLKITWITEPHPITGTPPGRFPEEGSEFKVRFKTKSKLEKAKLSSSRFLLSLEDVTEKVVIGAELFVKYTSKLSPLLDNGKPVSDH